MSALLHTGVTVTCRSFGVECIQPSVEVSGKLCLSFSSINSSNVVPISGRTCQKSFQTSIFSGIMLDGGSLVSKSSQYVGRHSPLVSKHKGCHQRCFGRPGAQGSAITAFNPLASQTYVA